ncbi:hypothetical protein PROPHIGD20-1_123 [Mycobacterium phage prophiGD20-1]|nr:hypothetical protein PROPHIGD20-1_123 [Mycobacterium phage prophiGD20-1]
MRSTATPPDCAEPFWHQASDVGDAGPLEWTCDRSNENHWAINGEMSSRLICRNPVQ